MFIHTLFLKTKTKKSKVLIVISLLSIWPCVRPSVMLFPPRPLDEIQTNLVCESLSKIGRATAK